MTSFGSTSAETQTCPSMEAVAIYIELAGTAGMVAVGRVLFAVGNASDALDGDLAALVLRGTVIFEA